MDKVKEVLLPLERKEDEDKLYGKNAAGTETQQPISETCVKNPLAEGHEEVEGSNKDIIEHISAPADLTGMTSQYVIERDTSPVSEQEFKKHGTSVGLASATMASGAVGEQNPST